MSSNTYFGVGIVVGVISFIGIWIAAFVNWGFLIGLAIGWLPAIIGAVIIGFTWPVSVPITVIVLLSMSGGSSY